MRPLHQNFKDSLVSKKPVEPNRRSLVQPSTAPSKTLSPPPQNKPSVLQSSDSIVLSLQQTIGKFEQTNHQMRNRFSKVTLDMNGLMQGFFKFQQGVSELGSKHGGYLSDTVKDIQGYIESLKT